MDHSKKQLAIALTLSTMFIILNIIAVTQGTEQSYYSKIEQFIVSLLS